MGVGSPLLNLMSDYFKTMTELITSSGGCLLEFIGDAILAIWNAPNRDNHHAIKAVSVALEMQHTLDRLRKEWDAKGYPRVRIRVGIHTAKVSRCQLACRLWIRLALCYNLAPFISCTPGFRG